MNKHIKLIEYKSKSILYTDFSGQKHSQVFIIMAELQKIVSNHPEKSVLALTNVFETEYNTEIIQAMKEFLKHNQPYVKASAVIGLGKYYQIIFQGILTLTGRSVNTFNDKQSALEWLATQ